MKKSLVVSLTLAVVAVGGATASGQSAGLDSVSGIASECVEFFEPAPGQILCFRKPDLVVEVESGPAGENPTGTVSLLSLGLTPGGSVNVSGEATCLSVSGRVAIVGLTGLRQQGGVGLVEPIEGLLRVVDAGGPSSGADTVEFAHGAPLPGPTACSTFPGPFSRDPLFFLAFSNATGDLLVTDTAGLPTAKDQ